jgi:hypothetical protein
MMLEGIGIGEVDRVRLMRVFGNIVEVQTKCLAEAPELDFALVLETEFKGLLCDLLRDVRESDMLGL